MPRCSSAIAPGAEGTLIVGAEHGDIMVHAKFAGHPAVRSC